MIKKITITKEDAAKAGNYEDVDNCLLATSLKRVFETDKIIVGPNFFEFNSNFYEIPELIQKYLLRAYGGPILCKPLIKEEISFEIDIEE